MLFAFGGLVLLSDNLWTDAGMLALMYMVFYVGLGRSLRQFPWGKTGRERLNRTFDNPRGRLGWPFDYLQTFPASGCITYRQAAIASTLIGWWIFCPLQATYRLQDRVDLETYPVVILVIACLALTRILVYCHQYTPPISIFGRLFSGRLIILGYDYIFLTPLTATLATAALLFWGSHYQIYSPIVTALAASIGLFIELAGGPSLNHWRLTAEHRITRRERRPAFVNA
jgi:hypothetical protein